MESWWIMSARQINLITCYDCFICNDYLFTELAKLGCYHSPPCFTILEIGDVYLLHVGKNELNRPSNTVRPLCMGSLFSPSPWLWEAVWGEAEPVLHFSHLVIFRLFVTQWTAACQASLSITNSQSLLKLVSIASVMPSNPVLNLAPYAFPLGEVKSLSRVWLFVTPWTVAYQAPLSMGFSRQQYWSGLPFPSPRNLPDPGMEPGSPAL